jgi:uroporphyrinogen-III decarboxylase
VAEYLNAQIDAGAQAVMIFDSWGGALADGAYQQFSLQYMQQVVSQLKREKDGVKIPPSCSPRAAASGSSRSPTSAPMPSVWTGPPT